MNEEQVNMIREAGSFGLSVYKVVRTEKRNRQISERMNRLEAKAAISEPVFVLRVNSPTPLLVTTASVALMAVAAFFYTLGKKK